MSIKAVCMIFVGLTLFYAGVLTLTGSFHVGVGMMIIGGLLIAVPVWQSFRHLWSPTGARGAWAAKTGKGKRKPHLTVIDGNKEEERPTYH